MTEMQDTSEACGAAIRVEVDADCAATRITVFGEIDLSTVASVDWRIRSLLSEAGKGHFLIDLRGVTFMDSTGWRLLLSLPRDARTGDFRLTVVRPPPAVYRAIQIAGLDRVLPFVGDPAESGVVPPAN